MGMRSVEELKYGYRVCGDNRFPHYVTVVFTFHDNDLALSGTDVERYP